MIAGVDVGNATTEVVVVKDGVPVAWDRVLTRGPKGGPASLRGAAALVDRLERETGERVEEVVLAPLRPVSTATLALPAAAPDTGRLRVVAAASPTPAGEGVAVGRPLLPGDQTPGDAAPGDKTPGDKTPGDTAPGDAAVVALVPRAMGYERAAAWVRTLLAAGVRVAGVLAEGDEARLIGNRIGAPLPVVDQVDLSALADAELVAVEVRPPGRPLAKLSDALFLKAAFPGSAPGEEAHAQAVCRELYDVSNAVVARLRTAAPPPEPAPEPPEATLERAVLDLDALAASVHARPRAVRRRSLLLATLEHEDEAPAADAEEVFRRPVRRAPSEAGAARRGALTTPGAPPGALVIDLGGGTVDVIGAPRHAGGDGISPDQLRAEAVAAGAGDLLTAAVAAVVGVPRGAAEWIKRGPCVRVENPHLAVGEDGTRTFLGAAAPPASVGSLAAPGPAGLLAFSQVMSPAEWRVLRRAIKAEVLGGTVRRALAALPGPLPPAAVVVGGPAGDDEVLAVLAHELPEGIALGRGDVAGALGHRYAVAYGLAVLPRSR